jgi:hypothetical protein
MVLIHGEKSIALHKNLPDCTVAPCDRGPNTGIPEAGAAIAPGKVSQESGVQAWEM